jgi:hypothetical protein
VLGRLGAHHRPALTLRYLDGLPVPEVARHLDRTVHATEALLVRARAAFRRIYGHDHPATARKIMKLSVDEKDYFSYRLTMDQISTLAARLHVDLRRQASTVCTRRTRAAC